VVSRQYTVLTQHSVLFCTLANKFSLWMHWWFFKKFVAFLQYISEFYHENPDSYSKECSELDQLRQVRELSVSYTGIPYIVEMLYRNVFYDMQEWYNYNIDWLWVSMIVANCVVWFSW